jgi:RNA polymerase sigma factor (sigma-70 family)
VVGRPRHESELVAHAQRGDLDAFEQLVREHQGIAFRTAYVIAGSAADAEEAVQDAFVKAHRALDRFRRDAPFRPWLLAIVANEARNRRRSSARRARFELHLVEERPSPDAAPSPEAALLAREQRERLLAALGTLAEEQRQAVACRYLLGLTERETAAALGCRPGTVKSRVSRALARLEEEL